MVVLRSNTLAASIANMSPRQLSDVSLQLRPKGRHLIIRQAYGAPALMSARIHHKHKRTYRQYVRFKLQSPELVFARMAASISVRSPRHFNSATSAAMVASLALGTKITYPTYPNPVDEQVSFCAWYRF